MDKRLATVTGSKRGRTSNVEFWQRNGKIWLFFDPGNEWKRMKSKLAMCRTLSMASSLGFDQYPKDEESRLWLQEQGILSADGTWPH